MQPSQSRPRLLSALVSLGVGITVAHAQTATPIDGPKSGGMPERVDVLTPDDIADRALSERTEASGAGTLAPSKSVGPPPTFQASAHRFDTVIFDDSALAGRVIARGRNWKAEFGPSGLTYTPVLGRSAPRSFETRFELSSVRRNGEELALSPPSIERNGHSVTIQRQGLREVYHLDADTVEQTFVFDQLSGNGDLVVEVDVHTPWEAVVDAHQIRFVDPAWGEVSYGRAFVKDASGDTMEIERTWTGSSIELTVPSWYLAEAVLPVTIDPPIGTLVTNTYGTLDDDSNVDAAWSQDAGAYFFVWEDYTSATDADVYVSILSSAGVQGFTYILDATSSFWANPAIAAVSPAGNLLVVASTSLNGPGSGPANIEGRFVNSNPTGTPTPAFVIDQTALDCTHPDVGGTFGPNTLTWAYCVVWEREFTSTDSDILARVVNADGSFAGAMLSIANSGLTSDFAPAVSKSRGDEASGTGVWNLAWIRDNDQNGQGTPIARQMDANGNIASHAELIVFNTALASNVDVTSNFDAVIPGTAGQRPYVVAFERNVFNGDIYASVMSPTQSFTTQNISLLEDFDRDLKSRDPSIATDGTSFFLAYDQLYWNAGPGTPDFDTYGLSGGIALSQNQARIALLERQQRLHFIVGEQARCIVASRGDGGDPSNDDALMMWENMNGANGSTITAMNFDSDSPQGSTLQALGTQYCEANPHGDSSDDGRRSSFMSMLGTGIITSTHLLRCDEMKLNAFGYFLVSTATGDVNMPAGAAGRLCLGGQIGRLVGGSVLSSGTAGSVATFFSPQNLPSPTGGFAASPGQTLYFQCWHRDVAGSIATSNFSNACLMTFRP